MLLVMSLGPSKQKSASAILVSFLPGTRNIQTFYISWFIQHNLRAACTPFSFVILTAFIRTAQDAFAFLIGHSRQEVSRTLLEPGS